MGLILIGSDQGRRYAGANDAVQSQIRAVAGGLQQSRLGPVKDIPPLGFERISEHFCGKDLKSGA
jgi:hypothetical protein